MELHTAVSQIKSNQINHVKSLRAMTKALTQKQNKTQIEIGWRLFLLVRFAQNILIHQHQKKSQPVRQTDRHQTRSTYPRSSSNGSLRALLLTQQPQAYIDIRPFVHASRLLLPDSFNDS
jgi:hypothetical protein